MRRRQRLGDLRGRHRRESQHAASRTDRGRQQVRARRHEHEDVARRRLLERLEQRVLRVDAEFIRVVDDDHPRAALEGPVADLANQLPRLGDDDLALVVGSLDEEHVRVEPPADAAAGCARSARVPLAGRLALDRLQAVQRLRKREGRLLLPDALGAGEHEAGRQRARAHRPGQQTFQPTMTDDFAEAHGRQIVTGIVSHSGFGTRDSGFGAGLQARGTDYGRNHTFKARMANTVPMPRTARYSRLRHARARLNGRSGARLAPRQYSSYSDPNVRSEKRLLGADRRSHRDHEVEADGHCRDHAAAGDGDADPHEGRPDIERMPRPPVGPGARDLPALLEVTGGPHPDGLSRQRDGGPDREQAPGRRRQPEHQRRLRRSRVARAGGRAGATSQPRQPPRPRRWSTMSATSATVIVSMHGVSRRHCRL